MISDDDKSLGCCKKSTKVNQDPAWTLSDYAESRKIKESTLRSIQKRSDDFPQPLPFKAAHKRFRSGKNLYRVSELDSFMKKRSQSKGSKSEV